MNIMQSITDYIMKSILTTHGDLVIRGAGVPERLAAVAVGQILRSAGVGAKPAWGAFKEQGRLTITHAEFVANTDAQSWVRDEIMLKNESDLAIQHHYAHVRLPHGAVVSKFTLYGYRNDAAAAMVAVLYRNDLAGAVAAMATVTADWTSGWSSLFDDTIASATIDNNTYGYLVDASLDPNDAETDVRLAGVQIEWA